MLRPAPFLGFLVRSKTEGGWRRGIAWRDIARGHARAGRAVHIKPVDVGVAVIAVPTLAVEFNVVAGIEAPVRFTGYVDRHGRALIAEGKLLRVDAAGIEASRHQRGIGHTIEAICGDAETKLARRGRGWNGRRALRIG